MNYFLVSALDVPDRRAHERDLLGHYLKALAASGVSAPAPADVNTATYARFGMAMLDHDTYAAREV